MAGGLFLGARAPVLFSQCVPVLQEVCALEKIAMSPLDVHLPTDDKTVVSRYTQFSED